MTGPSATSPGATGAHHVSSPPPADPGPWVGWIWFAGVIMVLVGLFNVVVGLTAVIRDEVFTVVPSGVLVFDLTTWGWIHLVLGLAQVAVAAGLFAAKAWALTVGVVIAGLNALAQLVALPYAPLWALIIIVLDCVVIYAMVVHGAEVRRALRR
ncbi:MAG: hypothetical protein M3235_12060 [Actinomycetota bacterium]|nr:hypothetical protein [Actinomycetota bacterium]